MTDVWLSKIFIKNCGSNYENVKLGFVFSQIIAETVFLLNPYFFMLIYELETLHSNFLYTKFGLNKILWKNIESLWSY